eukprot:2078875-Pleurochrysis_carterae.AAC.1
MKAQYNTQYDAQYDRVQPVQPHSGSSSSSMHSVSAAHAGLGAHVDALNATIVDLNAEIMRLQGDVMHLRAQKHTLVYQNAYR